MKASAHVIVLGNEKGGSGKTTISIHIIVALLKLGFKVGSIDIDARQQSTARYIQNREKTAKTRNIFLSSPKSFVVARSNKDTIKDGEQDEREKFDKVFYELSSDCDFIVVDSPGNDTYLSRYAHSFADTVVTPINDSFIDLDVLAKIDGETLDVQRPSIYSEMLWQQKMQKMRRNGGTMDWVVLRNRLPAIHSNNRKKMEGVLNVLSKRIGFRVASAFGERVIYRELFLQGLTVLDTLDMPDEFNPTMSHVSARQEIRNLIDVLQLPQLQKKPVENADERGGNTNNTEELKAEVA